MPPAAIANAKPSRASCLAPKRNRCLFVADVAFAARSKAMMVSMTASTLAAADPGCRSYTRLRRICAYFNREEPAQQRGVGTFAYVLMIFFAERLGRSARDQQNGQ